MKAWDDCSRIEKIARWENALRVLEALPPHERSKHWDMEHWGRQTDCGTVACAAGHCGMDPWFKKRGLELTFTESWGEKQRCDWNGQEVKDFFGPGAEEVFFYGDKRSVAAVIREVKSFLTFLRVVHS